MNDTAPGARIGCAVQLGTVGRWALASAGPRAYQEGGDLVTRAGRQREGAAEMQTMTLRDGRTVAFDDIGDRNGFPVIYNHGFLNSRLGRGPDVEVTWGSPTAAPLQAAPRRGA